jgi:hypothetical protein
MTPALDGENKTPLQTWPNAQDNIVIATLNSAPNLSVDGFARLLCKDGGRANKTHVSALRNALIQVYQAAAQNRLTARPAASQIQSAQQALSSFGKAPCQGPMRRRQRPGIVGSGPGDRSERDGFACHP